jgi:hypothetical protein
MDRGAIQDVLARYARAVDRGQWDDLWSVYHPDAYDDHVDFRGDVAALIAWLEDRFAGSEGSTHFLGNCLIEFAGPDLALVETYFVSTRLVATADDESVVSPADPTCRQSWGRYLDRFERRETGWRIARRQVVLDSRFTFVAHGGARDSGLYWGRRDGADQLHLLRHSIHAAAPDQHDI